MSEAEARQEFLSFMYELEEEPEHVLQVAKLALILFDQLQEVHSLGSHDRLILEAAACLHDIGWTMSAGGVEHHKASAKLIRNRNWRSFDPESVEIMAQTARYHRRALPEIGQKAFGKLSPANQGRVERLAAFLRIADGLDRRHCGFVCEVQAKVEPARILLHLKTLEFADKEIAAAKAKSDLAVRVFGREFVFTAQLVPLAGQS